MHRFNTDATAVHSHIQTPCTYSKKSHPSNSLSLPQLRRVLAARRNHHALHEESHAQRHRSSHQVPEHSTRSVDYHRLRHALLLGSPAAPLEMASRRVHLFPQYDSAERLIERVPTTNQHAHGHDDQTSEAVDATTLDGANEHSAATASRDLEYRRR